MKKTTLPFIFIGLIWSIVSCKKEIIEPQYISPYFDARNKVIMEINGKVDTNFHINGYWNKYLRTGLYDTVPFPRYYSCANEHEAFNFRVSKTGKKSNYNEVLDIYNFYPFINAKQKSRKATYFSTTAPHPPIAPKNACDYDSTISIHYGHIIESGHEGIFFTYKPNDVRDNTLLITSYDRTSGRMTGEFNLAFDFDDNSSSGFYGIYGNKDVNLFYESLPKEVKFHNCKFIVYMKEVKKL